MISFEKLIWLCYLAILISLGAIVSYTDIKYGKIKNKHLIAGFIAAAVINAVAIKAGLADLTETFSNFLFAFIFGALFWYFGLWTSADARLFSVLSICIPVSNYELGYMPYFPSAIILVNTFVPFFLFYFIRIIALTSIKQKIKVIKESLSIRELISLASAIFALEWAIKGLSLIIISIDSKFSLLFENYFFNILILALFLYAVEKASMIKTGYLFYAAVIARLIFDRQIYSLGYLKSLILIIAIFFITRMLILRLASYIYVIHCDIGLLKPGMAPAELIYKAGNSYMKIPELKLSMLSYFRKDKSFLISTTGNGLTKEDVKMLKKLHKQGKLGFEHLAIHQSLPFAPFLSIGAFLTFLAKGSIIIAIFYI